MNIGGREYNTYSIRTWARNNGFPNLGDRGRIPQQALAAFELHVQEENKIRAKKIQERQQAQLAKIQKPVKKERPQRKVAVRRADAELTQRVKPKKPGCPIHKVAMELDESENIWKCPEDGCVIKAFPKDGATKPSVGRGKLTLYRDDQNRFYLRADNGVSVEITQVATRIDLEHSRGPMVAEVQLTLYME